MRRLPLLAALVVLALAVPACAREHLLGTPPALRAMLEVLPADAVDRPLYFTDRTGLVGVEGFGSALPLGDAARLGFDAKTLSAVLETAGPPVTVLKGEIDPAAVVAGFVGAGYDVRSEGGWEILERGAEPPAGALPLVTAVPAVAVRDGEAVLADAAAVAAVAAGAPAAADLPWLRRLVDGVGRDAAAVVLGPQSSVFPGRAAQSGTDLRTLLEQAEVDTALAAYEGFALSYRPGGAGAVVLAYAEGEGGTEAAAQLAVRLTTARMLGDPARRPADVLRPEPPRWWSGARLVVLPVTWVEFDAAQVRADMDAGAFAFLAPLPPA